MSTINYKIINDSFKNTKIKYSMMEVKIDNIHDLKLNPYNDRFAMESHEWKLKQGKKLDLDEESQKYISEILWNKDKSHNKKTTKDILTNGVLKDIYIDQQGVILDGNRRIVILKNILKSKDSSLISNDMQEQFSSPKVVMIDEYLNESQIRDIETILQISEDEKIKYDPINMYIKIDRLFDQKRDKVSIDDMKDDKIYEDISKLLGPDFLKKDVKKNHEIFNLMKKYLRFSQKPDQYIFLRKKDDHLQQIYKFNNSWNKNSVKYTHENYDYKNLSQDIEELLFKLTTLRIEGKAFRTLVPSGQSFKSPLQHKKGYEQIKNFVEKKYCQSKIDSFVANNTNNDKAISNIINNYSNFQKTKNHKNATMDYFKRIDAIIVGLNSWFEGIDENHDVNDYVLQKFYKCKESFQTLAKNYKTHGKK